MSAGKRRPLTAAALVRLLPDDAIDDTMTDAHISYWAREADLDERDLAHNTKPDAEYVFVDIHDGKVHGLTKEDIRNAFGRIYAEDDIRFLGAGFRSYFAQMVKEADERTGQAALEYMDGDADDILVQVACFGEVVYG